MEGSDAGGKGGVIRRIVEPLDPRHYSVSTYAKPTFDEKSRHFLWRFWKDVPGLGGIALFDRSWYGRVLVEHVEGYATDEQWQRAYDEIVTFERNLVLEGVIIIKFWLQVSPEEQLRRFENRQADPLRRWKLTAEDWRNRDKIDQYNAAVEDMFEKTAASSRRGTSCRASRSAGRGSRCSRPSSNGSRRASSASSTPSPTTTAGPNGWFVPGTNRPTTAGPWSPCRRW